MAAQLIDIALGSDMDLYQDPFTGDFVLCLLYTSPSPRD